MHYLLKGFLAGMTLSLPTGPIAILCIRRTLAEGQLSGMLAGMGAATGDIIYGSLALIFLVFLTDFFMCYHQIFQFFGGIFLVYVGLMIVRTKHLDNKVSIIGRPGNINSYISTFLLTLANPLTIFAFAAIFAGSGLEKNVITIWSSILFVSGIVIGSMTIWALVTTIVAQLGRKLSFKTLKTLNYIAGMVIVFAGITITLDVLIRKINL